MCGRFALYASEDELVNHYKLKQGFKMEPRYNVAPSNVIPAIRSPSRSLDFIKWGFVPKWAKPAQAPFKGHINARGETLLEKPTFKSAFLKRRCLIPVSGYYEWKEINGKKQPYYIYLKERPILSLGGVWEAHYDEHSNLVETLAIITVQACKQVERVHLRMPLIVDPENFDIWLNDKTRAENLQKLLNPHDYPFTVQAVSPRVNSPKIDSIECLQSLS